MIDGQLQMFLDSSDKLNSKTFYYIRLAAFHKIPLVVHNKRYKEALQKESKAIFHKISYPKIISIDSKQELKMYRRKLLCDNHLVKYHDNYKYLRWFNDDEIRTLILSDMADGDGWVYN
ncbi:hypothetical protein [Paraliobacillus ryukyuensis]|uniref:hypothetical protein n=1 Tax=Paraliobacillus ryukyuensis TaxID=200904 RepID=UPI0009A66523|nr:hypothetical protein [Paraliobacillus ryukyuensis]